MVEVVGIEPTSSIFSLEVTLIRTNLNEFQDYYSELKGRLIGGANAQEFVGLMELGDKEKWLVFEAVGYEWWGYYSL